MSEQLQLRSGSASNIAAFTGAAAECVVDTTNNRLVLQDGSTVGGFPAAKLSEVLTPASVTRHATGATIAAGGLHVLTAAGLSMTLPSAATWTGQPIVIKDGSGSATPGHTISGNVDGSSSGTTITNPGQSLTLAADVTGATWWQI